MLLIGSLDRRDEGRIVMDAQDEVTVMKIRLNREKGGSE